MGVDLFFVLSGFLITGILLDIKESHGRILSFYARRALRIVPLFYIFILATLLIAPLVPAFADDPGLQTLQDQNIWYWTFLMNVKVSLEPLMPFAGFGNGHLWSLMVEEQFYLVWPIVILLLPGRSVLAAMVVCIVAAPAFRWMILEGAFPRIENAFAAYVLMPARMDALAFGALITWLLRERAWDRVRPAFLAAAAVSAIGLLALFVRYDELEPFDRMTQIAGYSAVAAVFATGVASAALLGNGARAHRLLSAPWLRTFGKYSYALYVVHYIIMFWADEWWTVPTVAGSDIAGRTVFTALTMGLAFATAWCTWRVIEAPALSLKDRFPYRVRQTSQPVVGELQP
jgi:peptidoglycan/LPS O-acetylase OafA/YrhL